MHRYPFKSSRAVLPLVLLLVCAATAAQTLSRRARQPVWRSAWLSKDPRQKVPEVFVAGQQATTLRFETPCDSSQTKLLGGEGRFEPLLIGGRSVVIVPIQDLAPDDRFLLQVTLTDGTSLPFTVTAAKDWVDGQVDILPDPESPKAVRLALEEKREENESLRAENSRYQEEETSVDHALAALLAKAQLSLTPFKLRQKWRFEDDGVKADALIFDGAERVAIVFEVTNLDQQRPWTMEEARLTSASTSQARPFALRMSPASIAPGAHGRIAIITDIASFSKDGKDGTDRLVLELFRDGGLRQAYVLLELKPQKK